MPTYSLSATRLLELSFYSNSNKHFGFTAELKVNNLFLNQLWLNNYMFKPYNIDRVDDFTFNLLERVHFYSANPYKKLISEIENIEYYNTSTVNYENFINIWSALISERFMFLDSLHNIVFSKQVERIWTNYIKYLDMHYAESLLLIIGIYLHISRLCIEFEVLLICLDLNYLESEFKILFHVSI